MSQKFTPPMIRLEQYIYTLAEGVYLYEVIIWLSIVCFMLVLAYVSLKFTIFNSNKKIAYSMSK